MARTSKPESTSTNSDRTLRRIGKLKRERAELEEEVLQLRAAVKIWTAVCDQAMSRGEDPESCSAEMQ
jgi:methylmalonyl-CoA mutase N-terminal domain/subunit